MGTTADCKRRRHMQTQQCVERDICPVSTQDIYPASAENIGPKLAQSRPKVGPDSAQSRPKVGPESARPKAAQSCRCRMIGLCCLPSGLKMRSASDFSRKDQHVCFGSALTLTQNSHPSTPQTRVQTCHRTNDTANHVDGFFADGDVR